MDIQETVKRLRQQEGERLKPYKCTAGKLTIGIGRNLEDRGITSEEAAYLCKNDIKEAKRDARRIFKDWESMPTYVQYIIVDMLFNLGYDRFKTFKKFIACVSKADYKGAVPEMIDSKWYRQTGDRAKRLVIYMESGGRDWVDNVWRYEK